MPDSKEIGDRLRSLRSKREKTIAEVANALGIAPSTLTAYELGDRTPRDEIKVKIANYYGRSVGSIFFNQNRH